MTSPFGPTEFPILNPAAWWWCGAGERQHTYKRPSFVRNSVKKTERVLLRLSSWPIKANQCVKHCSYCRFPLTMVHNDGCHTHHIQFKSSWTVPLRGAKGGKGMGAGALSKLFNIHVWMDSKVAQNWGRALFSTFPSLFCCCCFFCQQVQPVYDLFTDKSFVSLECLNFSEQIICLPGGEEGGWKWSKSIF